MILFIKNYSYSIVQEIILNSLNIFNIFEIKIKHIFIHRYLLYCYDYQNSLFL